MHKAPAHKTQASGSHPATVTDISILEDLDLQELRLFWGQHFGDPPGLRSVELLRLMLAWRIQAMTQGGLPYETRRKLSGRGPVQPEGMQFGIGTVFARDWQGQRVEVVLEPDGFRYDGQVYPSLSAAATAIAGTRWNGPRFFGLRKAST
ncbi:DUF2924 domain-containing protein [Marimonas sp. MJW-29]|uniref:DUF2924 domain-containing protein n=1 Tax=Sulfitobacter sediminis TaxID=3234186 RepID=A0ABV3RPQ9_9RHOB